MQITVNTTLSTTAPAGIQFGADTPAGEGAYPSPEGATAISDAGGTGLQLSGTDLVPAGAGVTAGTLTFVGGATHEVTTVANARSVATFTELISAANGTRAYGDKILLRTGTYNSAEAGTEINPTSAPTGTWNGSNHVSIEPHTGESPTFKRLTFGSDNGYGGYFKLSGVNFDLNKTVQATQFDALFIESGSHYMHLEDITMTGTNWAPDNFDDVNNGIRCTGGGGSDYCTLKDITITGTFTGCVWSGDNNTFDNVQIRESISDSFTYVMPMRNCTFKNLVSTDKPTTYTSYTITNIVAGNPTRVTVTDVTGIVAEDDGRIFGAGGFTTLEGKIGNISNIDVPTNSFDFEVNTTGDGPYTSGGWMGSGGIHNDHFQVLGIWTSIRSTDPATGVTPGTSTVLAVDDTPSNYYTVGDYCGIERAGSYPGTGMESVVSIQMAEVLAINDGAKTITVDLDTSGDTALGGTYVWYVYPANKCSDNIWQGCVFTRGNGTAGWGDAQGLFFSNYGAPILRNKFIGNVITSSSVYGIATGNHYDSVARYNSVTGIPNVAVDSDVQPSPGISITNGTLYQPNGSDWGLLEKPNSSHGNVANLVVMGSNPAGYNANNTDDLGSASASTAEYTTTLQAAFDDPQIDTERTITAANYATKTGSAGDLASPKRGATPHYNFTTDTFTDPNPLYVEEVGPLDGDIDAASTSSLTARFSENVSFGTNKNFYLYNVTDSTTDETLNTGTDVGSGNGTISISGDTVTFDPTSLTGGKTYTLKWDAGAVENAGGDPALAMDDADAWSFRVANPGLETMPDEPINNASGEWTASGNVTISGGVADWTGDGTGQPQIATTNPTYRAGTGAAALDPNEPHWLVINYSAIADAGNGQWRILVTEYNSGGTSLRSDTIADYLSGFAPAVGENQVLYTPGDNTAEAYIEIRALDPTIQATITSVSLKRT